MAANGLLIAATAFVAINLYTYVSEKSKTSTTVSILEADKAELSLKMAQSLKATEHLLYVPSVGPKAHLDRFKEMHKQNENQTLAQVNLLISQAQKILDQVLQKNPTAAIVETKYAIVTHELDEPNDVSITRLDHIDKEEAHQLAKALRYIYLPGRPAPAQTREAETTFQTYLPKGYYRQTVLQSLYRKAGMKAAENDLQTEIDNQSLSMVIKIVCFLIFVVLCVLAGFVVIVGHFFFLPRSPSAEEVAQIRSPVKFGFKTIFGVFIAWQATQLMLGMLLQQFAGGLHLFKAGENPLKAALLTAVLYLISNAPVFLYIYLIALKPHGLKFFDTLKLRAKVGRIGLGRLILFGFLTWISAFPVVLIAFFIASRFLGSEGSSNPIIPLVMESARTADLPVIFTFYLTLGVLAPICEESLFRGFLYTSLRQYWGILPCLLLTGGLFAAVHMDMGGFLPLFVLGFLFGYVLERTKSVVPSMIAHGLWNSGTFTVCLLLFGN
jgi:membrane protease YdiL (CAAX protease family)